MSLNEATFDRLINLARQRGIVSTEDLRQTLPINEMTVEDISDVICRLEEADFDLEIDPALCLPRQAEEAPKALTTTSGHAQMRLPEIGADVQKHSVSSMAVGSPVKKPVVRRPTNSTPAPVLLLLALAFAIGILVLVIAWPF